MPTHIKDKSHANRSYWLQNTSFDLKQAVVNLIKKAPTFPHPLALYEKLKR
ncbi:hypothetical protein HpDR147_14410 [Helicobacter pylori]